MYKHQLDRGMLFLHSIPWRSLHWETMCVVNLLKMPGVESVRSGRLGWISNSTLILGELAQGYEVRSPAEDVVRILRGLRMELQSVGRLDPFEAGGPHSRGGAA